MRLPMVGALVLLAGCTAPPAESTTGTGTVAIPAPGPATTSGPTSGAQGGDTLGLHRPLVLPTLAAGSPCPVSLTRRQPDPAPGTDSRNRPSRPSRARPGLELDLCRPQHRWGVDRQVVGRNEGAVGGGPHRLGVGPGAAPSTRRSAPGRVRRPRHRRARPGPQGPVDTGRVGDYPGYTQLRAPGCYGYQVDTAAGTSVIIFRAVGPTIAE